MDEILIGVNWPAVVIGAVASYALGWLWYSPRMFGKKWAQGVGITLGDENSSPMMAMIAQAWAVFLLAWLVGVMAANDALITTILVALTIVGLIKANGFFSQKSFHAISAEVGFVIVIMIVMVICQGIF